MAHRDPTPLKVLLPRVLARAATETGSARFLQPLFAEVVGEAIAQVATAEHLREGELTVRVCSASWARELLAREPHLRQLLCDRIGEGVVRRIVFVR